MGQLCLSTSEAWLAEALAVQQAFRGMEGQGEKQKKRRNRGGRHFSSMLPRSGWVICAYGAFRNHIAQMIDRSDGLPLGVCMRKLKCLTLYRVSKLPSSQFWLESKSRTRLFHFASKDLIALLRGHHLANGEASVFDPFSERPFHIPEDHFQNVLPLLHTWSASVCIAWNGHGQCSPQRL